MENITNLNYTDHPSRKSKLPIAEKLQENPLKIAWNMHENMAGSNRYVNSNRSLLDV